jgi:hypothetical protein
MSLPPIFLLGMMQRSGTNYLCDLLTCHRDVISRAPIHEDHLVSKSHLLVRYADEVAARWTPSWGVNDDEQQVLLRELGRGVERFLNRDADGKRVVSRMPSVANLGTFEQLFPDSPCVVLVRDGRSLVESGVRTFGWTYESSMRAWAEAAENILDAERRARRDGRDLIVLRYEDLLFEMPATMQRVLRLCGLCEDGFDLDQAASLPVKGSSVARGDAENVTWKPVDRPADFAPAERWHAWDPYLHHRFAKLAGPAQRALGYDLLATSTGVPERVVRDLAQSTAWRARPLYRSARSTLDRLRPSPGRPR